MSERKHESDEQKYVRWAVTDILQGEYDKAMRSIKWAKEESEKDE